MSLGLPGLSVREVGWDGMVLWGMAALPLSEAEAMVLPCPAVSVARGEKTYQIHFVMG